ncbi:MAG: hypothetical protein WCR33_00360 [Bacilli bacterium]
MRIYGKVRAVNKKARIISVADKYKVSYYHLTNNTMKNFKNYLYQMPYIIFESNKEHKYHNNIKCGEVEHFIKIFKPNMHNVQVYYDLKEIQSQIKDLMNNIDNKMFIDLEFSLVGGRNHVNEIIQYGILIEDKDGNKLFEDASLVKPIFHNSLNWQTLKFLNLYQSDFETACNYIEFYQLMQRLINQYDPKVIAWGKNDYLSLENSFRLNHLQSLNIESRYMNLMKVMKNYYQFKQEKGLFDTYRKMAGGNISAQKHDALEDAVIEREIFYMFKNVIN